jgi:hypothetical protein
MVKAGAGVMATRGEGIVGRRGAETSNVLVLSQDRSQTIPGCRVMFRTIRRDAVGDKVRIGVPITKQKVERSKTKRIRGEVVEKVAAGIDIRGGVNVGEREFQIVNRHSGEKNPVIEVVGGVTKDERAREEEAEMGGPERWRTPFPGPTR